VDNKRYITSWGGGRYRGVTFGQDEDGRLYIYGDDGLILRSAEINEILKAITPFYDAHSDEQIDENNARQQEYLENRRNRRNAATEEWGREKRADLAERAKTDGYVYLVQCGDRFKIGMSKDPTKRIKQLASSAAISAPLELICTIKTEDAKQLEAALHDRFSDNRVYHEWFTLSPQDVQSIKELSA